MNKILPIITAFSLMASIILGASSLIDSSFERWALLAHIVAVICLLVYILHEMVDSMDGKNGGTYR